MTPRKSVTTGSERAHIFRDRARGKELELTQLEAGQLAGDEVDERRIAQLKEQLEALLKAADDAEQSEAG